jgi:hypothetical protein
MDESPDHEPTLIERGMGVHLNHCQMVRSGQPTGVLIHVVYLFSGEESKAKNSKVAHEYVEHREHDELYWFGPPKSKTLHPALRFVLLRIAGLVEVT